MPAGGQPVSPQDARPLGRWGLALEPRAYQRVLLGSVDPADGATLHLVVPPGAGKTFLGLELARRNGRRAVVLTPTTVIRDQWMAQARTVLRFQAAGTSTDGASCADSVEPLVSSGSPPASGRSDEAAGASAVAALTVLTYQSLAVVDSSGPWEDAARRHWATELIADGRSPAGAEDFLSRLEADNLKAYQRGVSSRAAVLRRKVDELDEESAAALIAPGARARLDALVDAGCATVVLDECHHLRAHWAVVVHYLRRRLVAAGLQPTLIGLTATDPCDDDPAWERYHRLLGDVDAEVAVPAVIRAGDLAPARTLVRFTTPDSAEISFLASAGAELRHRISQLLLSPEGVSFLLRTVAPTLDPEESAADRGRDVRSAAEAALAAGINADPVLALSAASLLRETSRYGPTALSTLVVPLLPDVEVMELDEELRLLARYALDVLLPDPRRAGELDDLRDLLRGFGLHLTDAGLRSGRSPVDTVTAGSRAKDVAVVDVLRLEHDALGDRLRAVVITDAAERSAVHRALDPITPPGLCGSASVGTVRTAGGALRCFETVLADAELRGLHPVLLTSQHLCLASGDGMVLSELRSLSGLPLETVDDGWVLRVDLASQGAALVPAVSTLIERGLVRVLVGTRGLLGEGWDCPAVNTLVDLTTVTTVTTMAQMRGRVLRKDPFWPDKVAHTWVVSCLLPAGTGLVCGTEARRLQRKLDGVWGVRLPGPGQAPSSSSLPLVTGAAVALSDEQLRLLDRATAGVTPQVLDELNAPSAEGLGDRSGERRAWSLARTRIGEERASEWAAAAAEPGAGAEVETLTVVSVEGLLRRGVPAGYWEAAIRAVIEARVATGALPGCVRLLVESEEARVLTVALTAVSLVEARRFLDTVAELFRAPSRGPRFVLEVAASTMTSDSARPMGPVRRLLARILNLGGRKRPSEVLVLAVPPDLARSGPQVEALVVSWQRWVGPCRLRLAREATEADAMLAAHGAAGPRGRVEVTRSRRWVEGVSE